MLLKIMRDPFEHSASECAHFILDWIINHAPSGDPEIYMRNANSIVWHFRNCSFTCGTCDLIHHRDVAVKTDIQNNGTWHATYRMYGIL